MTAPPDADAFERAARAGDLEAVAAWLDAGLAPDAELGGFPLVHLAAVHKQAALVRLLLDRGADPAAGLHGASVRGSARVVKLLLEAGARPGAPHPDYADLPLGLAAWRGHAPVVKVLLAAGADPDARDGDDAPLTACARGGDSRGHVACVGLLLAAGADPAWRDARGLTAQEVAKAEGHARVAAALRGARRRRTAP